jgi:transketolase
MRALPNLEVIVPADSLETKSVTKYLAGSKNPSYLRLGKSDELGIHKVEPEINFGKVKEIIGGRDGTFLFTGSIGAVALKAAEVLLKTGIEVSVASTPFLSSLDLEYLISASSKGPIVTIEEHALRGGFGGAVLEFLNINRIPAKIGIIATRQSSLSQIGNQEFLRTANGLSIEDVVREFTSLLEG